MDTLNFDKTTAPWTVQQVVNLNKIQMHPGFHPFTCGNRGDGKHGWVGSDLGMLFATINGWVCPFCSYVQDWAYVFMAGGDWGDV